MLRGSAPILVSLTLTSLGVIGCQSSRPDPSYAVNSHDFTTVREMVRAGAHREPPDENVLHDTIRLGMAALADGDLQEATDALETAYMIQESGEVNDPGRVAAATLLWEGVKVWKGEPFEQAMADQALAVAYALAGDWQNVRIAARAGNRRLADYAAAREGEGTTYGDPDAPVETDFTAGWLLEAIADRVLGRESNALRSVLSLRPELEGLATQVDTGAFNTVAIIDFGLGPEKAPVGNDGESTEWRPRVPGVPGLRIDAPGFGVQASPTSDIANLAAQHRWTTAEQDRRNRSAMGTGMVIGGNTVMIASDHEETELLGLGIVLMGLLTKASAAADLRYNELLPAVTYIALLEITQPGDVVVTLGENPGISVVVPDVEVRPTDDPAVIYLRVADAPPPPYFTEVAVRYANDYVAPRTGAYPYILGGTCVATPSASVLATYQSGGYLLGMSLSELRELYAAERITLGSGPTDPDDRSHEVFRHVLEGGRALYTPPPWTIGYKRLMSANHSPYVPRSERVRLMAEQIRQRALTTAPPVDGG